jgi:RNA polymerase sigma-70 factor (ECF subfamily)
MNINSGNSSLSDKETSRLTRGMTLGEEKAYRIFYEHYAWRLFRKAVALLHGDPETAADLVQETMLRVVKSIRNFDTEPAFWNWLALILRNLVVDHFRARRVGNLSPEILANIPEETAVAQENDWDLDRAMSFLDSDAQELLRLKYQGSLSARKIAMRMGITEVAVESRLVRTRKELREILIRLGGKSNA